jgi:hypothetical protein
MYYNITLQPYPRVEWPVVLEQAESRELEESGVVEVRGPRRELPRLRITPYARRRIAVVAGAIVMLFVGHQYYYGGRIPLIREPEHFRVDPTPAAKTPQIPEYQRE